MVQHRAGAAGARDDLGSGLAAGLRLGQLAISVVDRRVVFMPAGRARALPGPHQPSPAAIVAASRSEVMIG
ncbi:hypothetical protein KC238_25750, partial [Mycobacteroides chelonae]